LPRQSPPCAQACDALGKRRSGIDKLSNKAEAEMRQKVPINPMRIELTNLLSNARSRMLGMPNLIA
jgi:hypothetical protein